MFSTQKRCLIGIPIRGYQHFYSLPPKNWIFGPKTAKFGSKYAFDPMAGQKIMRIRSFCGSSVMWIPKILLSPVRIRIFAKKGQICPKIGIFGHFGPGLASSFGVLLVGWLVVVVRGLNLARHLFTLWYSSCLHKTFSDENVPLEIFTLPIDNIWVGVCMGEHLSHFVSKYGTSFANVKKTQHTRWGNNSGSNSLRGSSASYAGLVLRI